MTLAPFFESRRVRAAFRVLPAVILTAWAVSPTFTVESRPFAEQETPDSIEYADGAWQLGHGHGYVTFFDEPRDAFGTVAEPPRYPFGTSAALAPFAAVSRQFPGGIQTGSRFYSALYVLVVVIAAWRINGPLAAAIAAGLIGISPFARESATFILSDALAAMLTVAILIALSVRSVWAGGAAGAMAGALVTVRLLGVVSLPAVLVALRGRRRMVAAISAAPFVGGLALYQWKTFGSPLRTGYDYWVHHLQIFSPAFVFSHGPANEGPFVYGLKLNSDLFGVCPCGVGGPVTKVSSIVLYPSVAIGLFWLFAPPPAGLVGLIRMVTDRATVMSQYALITVLLNVGLVLFYFDRSARFIAPAASLLLVYSAAAFKDVAAWIWTSTTGRLRPLLSRTQPRSAP
jgi:hypothetical protein